MSELADWGLPSWVPPAVAARAARDDAREALAARRAEEERERLAEERHQRALALYCQQAELRGEAVTVMDLAAGRVSGRPVGDILAAAAAAAEVDDRREALRVQREGHGDPEPLHVEFDEPRILAPAARSATGRAIAIRARRFAGVLDARRKLAAAERAAEASRNDYGLVEGVTLRSREDRDAVIFARAAADRAGERTRHVSYR